MHDLFITTYCYGSLGLTPEKQILTAKAQGFQGLEFLCPVTEEIAQVLRREEMKIADSTVLPDFEDAAQIDLLHSLGVSWLQCSTRFGNREQVLRAAELMNALGRTAADRGFRIFYHNHTHEWRKAGEETLLDLLLDNTDPQTVSLQMDAGWAFCAGVDPEAFIRRHPGRVELMHVKACTGVLGPEGVSFVAPGPDEAVSLGGPPAPESDPGGAPAGPPGPPPEMQEAMARIRSVSGPMRDCIGNYGSLLRTARDNGCRVFILERDEFYQPDVLTVLAEDLAELRKFW